MELIEECVLERRWGEGRFLPGEMFMIQDAGRCVDAVGLPG
jgi:hypothetical protein